MRSAFTDAEKAELCKWQSEHRWSPNQLRHTAGTAIRKRFGLEAAQVSLPRPRGCADPGNLDISALLAESTQATKVMPRAKLAAPWNVGISVAGCHSTVLR
ncbi:hypothetical protein OAS39_01000 [Pirellulales bacterium]|nr:hypothetical protein [Pirellulales bacterium]